MTAVIKLTEYLALGGKIENLPTGSIIDAYNQPPFTFDKVGGVFSIEQAGEHRGRSIPYKVTYFNNEARVMSGEWLKVKVEVALDEQYKK